jgi:hypothetical protein
VGFLAVKSAEHLASHGVFFVVQVRNLEGLIFIGLYGNSVFKEAFNTKANGNIDIFRFNNCYWWICFHFSLSHNIGISYLLLV